jgi:hypothetical protein
MASSMKRLFAVPEVVVHVHTVDEEDVVVGERVGHLDLAEVRCVAFTDEPR